MVQVSGNVVVSVLLPNVELLKIVTCYLLVSKLHVDGGEGGEGVSDDELLVVVGVGVDSDHAELLVLSGEGGGDSELHVVGGEGVRGDDLLGVS